MNPELQTLVDRIELVERQSRGWQLVALLALLVAGAAVALPFLRPNATPGGHARFTVVEANRFLLRDLDGSLAGGLENLPDGTVRLVLGGPATASAHLLLPRGGGPQFTLRAPDGRVRIGLDGANRPGIWLSRDGRFAQAALGTTAGGDG